MAHPFDQLAKKIGLRALGPSGFTAAEHEILSNAHQADLRHDPDPARHAERARLGLLGRMAAVPCLIELFSAAPGEEQVADCVGKVVAFRQERRREAAEGAVPVKPFLWIVTAGRPITVIASLCVVPALGWPEGVYAMQGASSGGPPGIGGLLRVAIVVASELPRVRETLLVRIMAGGPLLAPSLAELAALPHDAPERAVASKDVLELRRALGSKERRSAAEEEFIVSTQDILEELRDEGRVEGMARALLSALRLRGVAVPEAARERILAQKDLDRLERWFERAMVARSVAEVLDEPS